MNNSPVFFNETRKEGKITMIGDGREREHTGQGFSRISFDYFNSHSLFQEIRHQVRKAVKVSRKLTNTTEAPRRAIEYNMM